MEAIKIRFVSLHHHTTHSYGDGFGTPAQHVARAAELGYTAIAATEHGNVSSFFQLEKAALKAGIKPIFGIEAYCGATGPAVCVRCGGSGHTGLPLPIIAMDGEELAPDDTCPMCKGSGAQDKQQFKNHLTILAEDIDGYRNLNRIVTQSYLDYYYHPTVSGASLLSHRQGLIVLSGCSGSLLACTLIGGKGIPEPGSKHAGLESAGIVAERFRQVFGESYFLEVQPFPELESTRKINPAYEQLAAILDLDLVVTHDVHYPRMEDAEMQAVLHAVHRGKASVDDAMREWNYAVPMTLPESDEILAGRLMETGLSNEASWAAIFNSAEIAERCNVTLPKAERLHYQITEEDMKPWV